VLVALALAQKTPVPKPLPPAFDEANWVLSFSDQFEGGELDLAKWTPHDLAGRKAYSADAVQIAGGQLQIAALPGIVTTYGKFAQKFGRIEVRYRLSGALGGHVSLRLLPIPSGRLPGIEAVYAGGNLTLENHWGTEQTERTYGDAVPSPDFYAGFHTVTIEWERDHISWFIDNKEKMRSMDGVPQQPLYLTLEAEGNVQSVLNVEYVRVYRRK